MDKYETSEENKVTFSTESTNEGNTSFDESSDSSEDVEKEDQGDEPIRKPYDPSKIDVDIQVINLGFLIDMLQNDEIVLQADFQRASDLWTAKQKSRLIESILLGLPLPSFYFDENQSTKKLSVIDGLQRLCAISDFVIHKKLTLEGLEFLTQFNQKRYEELGRVDIRRINSLKVILNILRKETPIDVKYILFQRVNTAGLPLTPQEMRHALNQGSPAKFIQELAESDEFREVTGYKIKIQRMEDRDFANRFVAFYLLDNIQDYEEGLDDFMNDGMQLLNSKTIEDLAYIKKAFLRAMQVSFNIFGNDAFRKRSKKDDRRKPISKALYDTLSVNIAKLDEREQEKLVRSKERLKEKLIELQVNDPNFVAAITTGTAKKQAVGYRFNAVKELLKKIIAHD
jgi:hypothetical protein